MTQENEDLYEKIKADANSSGYFINPDVEFTKELIDGLRINEKRYGYPACPCRLAEGIKEKDLDLICPCDYRDPDLNDFGACYCALYVSQDISLGEKKAGSIPDRRLSSLQKRKNPQASHGGLPSLSFPVWRCKVCGYLCAREGPPGICPICKVTKERFERFL